MLSLKCQVCENGVYDLSLPPSTVGHTSSPAHTQTGDIHTHAQNAHVNINVAGLQDKLRRVCECEDIDISPLCGPQEHNRELLEMFFEDYLRTDAYLTDSKLLDEITNRNPKSSSDFMHMCAREHDLLCMFRVEAVAETLCVHTYLSAFKGSESGHTLSQRCVDNIIDCVAHHWLCVYAQCYGKTTFTHYMFSLNHNTTPDNIRSKIWERLAKPHTHTNDNTHTHPHLPTDPPQHIRIPLEFIPYLCVHLMRLHLHHFVL